MQNISDTDTGVNFAQLKRRATKLRRHMLTMAAGRGQGYLGQGLGIADLMAALYFHEMKYDPKNPKDPARDRFVMSTGHYSIALWAALVEAGTLPEAEAWVGAGGRHGAGIENAEVHRASLR
jgi:transketolase N-terminal domain/subunit